MDSPVTQTRLHDTDTGNATLMVGTDSQEAFEKALPVLQAMAKYVFHMGGLGSGHVMKTLNNVRTLQSSSSHSLDHFVINLYLVIERPCFPNPAYFCSLLIEILTELQCSTYLLPASSPFPTRW